MADTAVLAGLVTGQERTFDQDPLFAFRLLADIAMRALSPAVNDPATAVQVLDTIESLLQPLASRDLDVADVTDSAGTVRVVLALPSWMTTCAQAWTISSSPRPNPPWSCWRTRPAHHPAERCTAGSASRRWPGGSIAPKSSGPATSR